MPTHPPASGDELRTRGAGRIRAPRPDSVRHTGLQHADTHRGPPHLQRLLPERSDPIKAFERSVGRLDGRTVGKSLIRSVGGQVGAWANQAVGRTRTWMVGRSAGRCVGRTLGQCGRADGTVGRAVVRPPVRATRPVRPAVDRPAGRPSTHHIRPANSADRLCARPPNPPDRPTASARPPPECQQDTLLPAAEHVATMSVHGSSRKRAEDGPVGLSVGVVPSGGRSVGRSVGRADEQAVGRAVRSGVGRSAGRSDSRTLQSNVRPEDRAGRSA